MFNAAPRSIAPLVPVIDVHFAYGGTTLRWFSVVSTIGTPVDITAQELRLEAFFPADDVDGDKLASMNRFVLDAGSRRAAARIGESRRRKSASSAHQCCGRLQARRLKML